MGDKNWLTGRDHCNWEDLTEADTGTTIAVLRYCQDTLEWGCGGCSYP